MLTIKTIGSGSSGNAFVLDDGHTQLLLECGLSFNKIAEKMSYDFRRLSACLITHEHLDHCKGVAGFTANTSVSVLASNGTVQGIKALNTFKNGLNDAQIVPIDKFKYYEVKGGWKIATFDVEHEGNEPTGFLIESKNNDKILFATDTSFIKYIFKDLTHIIIEANYSEEILQEKDYHPKLKERIRKTHYEINNVIKFIKASREASSRLHHVFIIHTSSVNGNPKLFQKMIEEQTGIYTEIALENKL